MNERLGLLISFEGSEGCGKSTQIKRIAQRLETAREEYLVTREPGGTALGEEIRHLLKYSPAGQDMHPETELLLFAASRAQLVREIISPALDAGKLVLCDRYLDSTTVYQGVARKISADPVQMVNKFAIGDLVPDLTVVIDIPAEIGFERIKNRKADAPDRMEQESIEFYKQVREGYLILAKTMPERFFVVDGTLDEDTIEALIWEKLQNDLL